MFHYTRYTFSSEQSDNKMILYQALLFSPRKSMMGNIVKSNKLRKIFTYAYQNMFKYYMLLFVTFSGFFSLVMPFGHCHYLPIDFSYINPKINLFHFLFIHYFFFFFLHLASLYSSFFSCQYSYFFVLFFCPFFNSIKGNKYKLVNITPWNLKMFKSAIHLYLYDWQMKLHFYIHCYYLSLSIFHCINKNKTTRDSI